ncbi:MAG: SDR family NAD(P)-dependent oxidoreductase [Acidimicrobiales bacterium]
MWAKSYSFWHDGRVEHLASKTAVVTGGASGIGLALGEAFARESMKVVLADVDEPGLAAAAESLVNAGAEVHTVVCDVSDDGAVEHLRDEALSRFGAVHVVCNNAGVGGGGPIWEAPLETWKWVMGVNFWGVLHGIRAFTPLLIEQGEGHLVNTASAAGIVAAPFMGSYCASKHAVVAISEILSAELHLISSLVRASVVCPMWVRTRISESDRNAPAEVLAATKGREDQAGFRDVVTRLIDGGLPPAVVASAVLSAVKEGRFWVFPHEEVKAQAVARAERIAREEIPVFEASGLFQA